MHAVMLKPSWPASFTRSVRDKDSKILKTLVFSEGDPQLLDDMEFAAVKKDLGVSLVMAHIDSDGIPTGKVAKETDDKPVKPAAKKAAKPEKTEKLVESEK